MLNQKNENLRLSFNCWKILKLSPRSPTLLITDIMALSSSYQNRQYGTKDKVKRSIAWRPHGRRGNVIWHAMNLTEYMQGNKIQFHSQKIKGHHFYIELKSVEVAQCDLKSEPDLPVLSSSVKL
jgi:hypothetical protein